MPQCKGWYTIWRISWTQLSRKSISKFELMHFFLENCHMLLSCKIAGNGVFEVLVWLLQPLHKSSRQGAQTIVWRLYNPVFSIGIWSNTRWGVLVYAKRVFVLSVSFPQLLVRPYVSVKDAESNIYTKNRGHHRQTVVETINFSLNGLFLSGTRLL